MRAPSPRGDPPPADPLRLPHTDWLRHDLIVTGPAADVAALREAAAGAGAIPWVSPDRDHEEAARVHSLLRPPDGSPGLTPAAARALARLLRAAAETQEQRVIAAAGRSRACPFDLHALVPVPDRLLRLGPDDPASIAWLRQHWGTVQALRHVRVHDAAPDRRRRHSAQLHYTFWAADWTPWAAVQTIRVRWPTVVIELRPEYGLG